MSVRTLTAVMDNSGADLGARLVAFVLADAAHDDGITWIGQDEIARKAKLNQKYVIECLKKLVSLGELDVKKVQRGRVRLNVYRLRLAPVAKIQTDKLPTDLWDLFADDVSISDVGNDDVGNDGVTTSDSAGLDSAVTRGRAMNRNENRNAPSHVDRRKVTDSELTLAQFILSAWNGRTGQALTAKGHLSKIIMRIREHPELALDEHVAIIDRNLANPWWRGAPSPAVIYGNDALFEQSMQRQDNNTGRGDRVLEPGEVAEALRNASGVS